MPERNLNIIRMS